MKKLLVLSILASISLIGCLKGKQEAAAPAATEVQEAAPATDAAGTMEAAPATMQTQEAAPATTGN